ncbi:Xylose isomerase-like TIM barrel [Candidatus Koribacter versatilis Ellin345]|uniref:Xylose isomerase-like TIM barrel n=1 Tax=Koribacter versatilis (strain Ellin345) TaxID=204669 RepID=Q1IMQ1_KORVE|nr:sugar phosphate isomerase/epimerase family protein [Candidatus Koribacter versatilis]ABF41849.1 Xylose isomerase-like TIM barrel [Candidatus Koribacter versatilis Ellin345]
MSKLGIMQGRLVPPEPGRFQSFPRARWADEFANAAAVPIDYIEWIVDHYGDDVNPLRAEKGIEHLQRLMDSTGVAIRAICADYFMDFPFVRCTAQERAERLAQLQQILKNGRKVGVLRVVIPFVDISAIKTDDDFRDVVNAMRSALPYAEETGLELHLETSLGPADFKRLLDELPHPLLKANYDSGNSSSLGYNPADEFGAYGDRVGSVHIKDRVKGGSTVPLGTGDADFPTLFRELERVRYAGDFTLQVARGEPDNEVEWTKSNVAFVRKYLNTIGSGEAA